MASRMTQSDLDMQEQFARIRQLVNDAEARMTEREKAMQEIAEMRPRMMLTYIGTGAALMGATVAIASLFIS